MTLLAALTSVAGDPIQIHKKVGWNNFVRSFLFQMFQLIIEHVTYSYGFHHILAPGPRDVTMHICIRKSKFYQTLGSLKSQLKDKK